MDEDDMIVVVVGDTGSDDLPPSQTVFKSQPVDESDVINMIETVQKHGKPIKLQSLENNNGIIKEEFCENDFHEYSEDETILVDYSHNEEYLIDEDEVPVMKAEYDSDKDYIPEDNSNIDDDDDGNDDDDFVPKRPTRKKKTYKSKSDSESEPEGKSRRKHVSPSRRKSFVQDLKQEYPDLQSDQNALIKTLAEIMRNIEKPPLPTVHFKLVDTQYECTKCGAMTETEPAAGRHYQEYHGPRYLVCFACGVDFRSTTNLYKHEKRCVAPDACTVLKARALSLGRKGRSRPYIPKPEDIPLREPIARKSTVANKFICKECPGVFTSKKALDAHENLHRGLRPYRCQECSNAYTSYDRLKRHMKLHSAESFVCDHCGRIFKVKAALSVHLDSHMPVPKFGCEKCPRRYATKAALMHHVRRIHLQLPPPCACPICPKSYPRMSLVKDHMKKAHGMSLMTRRMFFKQLPKMTEEELQQAKEILKSSDPVYNLSNNTVIIN